MDIDRQTIEREFKAIGGRAFRHDRCDCDYAEGDVPCDYCAAFDVLSLADRLLKRQEDAEAEAERGEQWNSGLEAASTVT
jgi:hypothetical protein